MQAETPAARRWWRGGRALLVLLLAAAGLRAALVLGGGQSFFPDEIRFARSIILLLRLQAGRLDDALEFGLAPDHTAWVWVGAGPALVQAAWLTVRGLPLESTTWWAHTAWISALVLSLASTAVVGLVHAVARRAGAPRDEALLAALLAACATSLLYFSRHLLPYDAALALGLAALWVGLTPAPRLATSAACGLLAGATFLTYNAYWLLAAGVLVAAAARAGCRPGQVAALGLGAAAPPALVVALDLALRGGGLLSESRSFAASARQGAFEEGWRLPWEYLWEAEGALLAAWVAAAACAAARAARGGPGAARGRLWLGLAVGLYAALALASTGLEAFVVYGRTARVLVPFLCLAAAWALVPGLRRCRPGLRLALLALLLAHTAARFEAPLALVFPAQAWVPLSARFGPFAPTFTVRGPALPARPDAVPGLWLVNGAYFHPFDGPGDPAPAGEVLWQAAHPLEFRPYQYEGFTPVQRRWLREEDVGMRVVREAAQKR